MNTTATYTMIQINQYDPTRTLTLRNAWVRAMNKRFNDLIAVIRKAIIVDDCFGLKPQTYAVLSSPGREAFNFPRTSDKLKGFMDWLNGEVEKGILETAQYQRIGSSVEPAWTNLYVQDSYKRGVLRARTELRKAGYTVPPTTDVFGGVDAIMGTPFHIDRVGLLYTRVFSDLKGITTTMDTQISRILGQGLVDGDNPTVLARKLVATIDGSGAGELGIRDSLGRFIPAKRRAATLARTEVIRAHHMANIQEYENWGVTGVEVIAEFVTAGDDRVCDECAGYHGNRYTLKVARHMIPVHPNCRCIVIPVDKRDVTGEIFDELPKKLQKRSSTPKIPDKTMPKWTDQPSLDLAKDSMSKYNNAIYTSESGAQALKRVNVVGDTIANQIWGTLDDLAVQAKGQPPWASIHMADSANPTGAVRSVFAQYNPIQKSISVGTKAVARSNPALNLGGGTYNVGTDLATVIRHEYGHHIWHNSSGFNIPLEAKRAWRTFYKENTSIFRKKVSEYSATNHDEAFAECFAAYTSPKYGVTKRLPEAIEKLLENLIGKRL